MSRFPSCSGLVTGSRVRGLADGNSWVKSQYDQPSDPLPTHSMGKVEQLFPFLSPLQGRTVSWVWTARNPSCTHVACKDWVWSYTKSFPNLFLKDQLPHPKAQPGGKATQRLWRHKAADITAQAFPLTWQYASFKLLTQDWDHESASFPPNLRPLKQWFCLKRCEYIHMHTPPYMYIHTFLKNRAVVFLVYYLLELLSFSLHFLD